MLGQAQVVAEGQGGPAPVSSAGDRFAIPPPEFDEALYLKLNPDVAAKVEAEPGNRAAGATSSSRGGSKTGVGVPPSVYDGGSAEEEL